MNLNHIARSGNLPNESTLATTSTASEPGELPYCVDFTEHVYVKEVEPPLTNDVNLTGLIVSTAF